MRKFLSLVLALVMMMSLVTINVGAKEFTDGDDITYQEAVDVISTIHVVDGYSDGDFKPGNNLSRGAAAKIICNMILGPTTAAELHADTAPYRDVPVTNDFAGYIAYCQKEGIISGYADGSFRPAGTLTGYAFMKMLLGALGYDAEIEGYTGPNWSINVAKKAISLGLSKSLEKTFNGVDFVTREEAALYAFNTLRADLVEYSSKITATVNGAEVTVGNSNATPQEWGSQMTRRNNIYPDPYVQFAEQYFNKLVLTEAMDCFGRPDREWKYDGDEIGAYLNMDLFKQEYTTKVTGRDLYDLLGSRTIDDYSFSITIDGETTKEVLDDGSDDPYFTKGNLIRSNTEGIGATGNGVLTQVFVDNDKDVEHVWIAIINTYLAKATDDYNEKKDEATYTVWSLFNNGTSANPSGLVKLVGDRDDPENVDLTVSGEDFDIEDVKEDDIVLVHVAEGEIKEILDPEVIDDTTLVSFKNGDWVKADEQYDYAHSAQYDVEVLDQYNNSNMKDVTYRLFLDEYGYLIGIELIEEPNQYVFLTGIDLSTSNLSNKTADGNVIHLDGTMETVRINMDKSENADGNKFSAGTSNSNDTPDGDTGISALMNTWCRYTVNNAGVYTLTEVPNDNTSWNDGAKNNSGKGKAAQGRDIDVTSTDGAAEVMTLDKSHIYMSSAITALKRVYGNDDTVFLTVETDVITATNARPGDGGDEEAIIISDVDSVATGAQKVNLKAWSATKVIEDKGDATDLDKATTADLAKVSNGVYSLFSDKGFVIATVVVGEDDGTTSNYAFVTSGSMQQEDYSSADDEYTWSREVIINGELTTITEKGDSDPDIEDMARGEWYEVKYYGDGTVRGVTALCNQNITPSITVPARDFVSYASPWTSGKYIKDIKDVEAATDDENTVLLWTNLMDDKRTVKVEGSTLQVLTNNTIEKKGFSVHPDAKVVLVQDVLPSNRNIKWMDDIEEMSGTGTTALERAVKRLNNNEAFVGFIGAVFENGLATSVVIYDKTETDIDRGEYGDPGNGLEIHEKGNGDIEIFTDEILNARQIANVIKDYLNDNTIESVTYSTDGSATITYSDGTTTVINAQVKVLGTVAEVQGAALINKVQDVIDRTDPPVGEITIDGNHMTATGSAGGGYTTPGSDGTAPAVKDFVGFLVGLRNSGASTITFDGTDYKWNRDIHYASKWVTEDATTTGTAPDLTTSDTLVTAVVTEIGTLSSSGDTGSVTLIVDGAELVFTIALGA